MITSSAINCRIDGQILIINKFIYNSIDKCNVSERGYFSQAILAQLRNFVEHIMLKIYANGQDIDDTYDNICDAIAYVKARGNLKFLRQFHDFLQSVASHYTLEKENSERLMLKYYEYLLKIRIFLKSHYSLDVLENLDKFPLNTDSNLNEYYEKIAVQIRHHEIYRSSCKHNDRFYIQKIKPFFTNQRIYYEVTLLPAFWKASKFDEIIAFTNLDISHCYAVKLFIVDDAIMMLDKIMPIYIIVKWETSIRPCEINNFSAILGEKLEIRSNSAEYRELMRYLTETGFNLVELIDLSDVYYQRIKEHILLKAKTVHFLGILDRCRAIIKDNLPGSNVLRYLLYQLNNRIIKDQLVRDVSNNNLSELCLDNRCIPFDKMPFNSALKGHNPKLGSLFDCINSTNRKHELFARYIKNNTEIKGQLYTSIKEIINFDNIYELIQLYNSYLWFGHTGRRLEEYNGHIYIREYEENTLVILQKLRDVAQCGVVDYPNLVETWLRSTTHKVDCNEKKTILKQIFLNSKVALIYGSAGTGKSTLINHISHLFFDKTKLYLANTHSALDNLKRRVDTDNCIFMTITKCLAQQSIATNYDILIIDECSMVSNRDMRHILKKVTCELLVLVGDTYQIEAIQFGNWFSAARSFIPQTSVFELTTPYRNKNDALLDLWTRVRNMDNTILEHIAKKNYSATLDASIFEQAEDNEIILCFNYDGLYGINNINRFLQQSNPNIAVFWGVQQYKINDPILFNESNRFAPLIYNNMKGRIVGIQVFDNQIQFDIELDKDINGIDVNYYDFTLLNNSQFGNSVIRFLVNKYKNTDEDDDISASDVVPFQVAYAVSIHKAQGLEYNSVKIVITDEIDELVTHDIFYTAITRAREKLKIYWTPEVEKKVLNNIKPRIIGKDVALLKSKLP
jgi:Cdc6-like AAA superfamily ATPase